MSKRTWNAIAWVTAVSVAIVGIIVWLGLVALIVVVAVSAVTDIWDYGVSIRGSWEKIALLVVFIWTLLIRRRLRKLEERMEQLRMTAFATASYFNFAYGNERLDSLIGLGAHMKHSLWRGWHRITGSSEFTDDILMSSYAARHGRKVTLLDDLRATFSATVEKGGEVC
jgi:hypothetical protein